MIHTSDGETFEDEVGHSFGQDMMKDVSDTKMVGNKADLDIEPETKNTFKQGIDTARSNQEDRNAAFDIVKGQQDYENRSTMGLGPSSVDKALQEWGSKPLRADDTSSYTPGINSEGNYGWNRIAMEPFDPSSMAPLGVPKKVEGEGGGGIEKIRSPAVQHPTTGEIYEDMNHGLAAEKAEEALGFPEGFNPYTDLNHGFTTTHGRFVGRQEANTIADAAAQKVGNKTYIPDPKRQAKRGLISEDLDFVQKWMMSKYAPVWERIKNNLTSVKDK